LLHMSSSLPYRRGEANRALSSITIIFHTRLPTKLNWKKALEYEGGSIDRTASFLQ
jgi:hypothetical protein